MLLIQQSATAQDQRPLDEVAKLPQDGVSRACRIEAELAAARVIFVTDKTAGIAPGRRVGSYVFGNAFAPQRTRTDR